MPNKDIQNDQNKIRATRKRLKNQNELHPSIHRLPLILVRVAGRLEFIPATIGRETGCTLDRLPVANLPNQPNCVHL